MIALPLIRKAQEDAPNGLMSEKEAEELLKTCMKVLFYRDARSLNKVGHAFSLYTLPAFCSKCIARQKQAECRSSLS